jgi:hypothetical protein
MPLGSLRLSGPVRGNGAMQFGVIHVHRILRRPPPRLEQQPVLALGQGVAVDLFTVAR